MSSNEGLQQVTRLVNTFLNRPDTLAFRTPVDPKAMNIPDYFQIVKNPMDLGTVKAKLEGGRYERAEDVARDIRLIWSNCILYNSPGSEFGLLAAGLAKKFEERFSKVRIIADKEREKKPSLRLDPIDARPPTLDEKVRFTYDLYRTTKVEVGQVMEQVDARCPQALKSPAEDEVELNVDMLDPLTFRVIERLIREALLALAAANNNTSSASTTATAAASSSSASASSSASKAKSGGGGGGGGPKKRKGADGESRPKKQRT
eukprot:jgi/Undpi1/8239/HiC_scaffold_25.g10709.m1